MECCVREKPQKCCKMMQTIKESSSPLPSLLRQAQIVGGH